MMETRPPISKAKMMSITKSALKAIKFYKHIVMNVEKFISKVKKKTNFEISYKKNFVQCKPEYKIPGLYVIDSIIRQSRHQHGIEKDVYGSRFAKNILSTLQHVNKCPKEDKVILDIESFILDEFFFRIKSLECLIYGRKI